MARISTKLTTSNVKSWEELRRYVSQDISLIVDMINGRLDFSNLFTSSTTAKFTSANTDLKIDHTLGKIPQGYILTRSSVAMSLYDGAMEWTDKELFLKSNAIGDATILIF